MVIRPNWSWMPAAAVLVCAAVEVRALADRSRGEPRNHDIRRYVVGEISESVRVEQRFLVKADGLSSITIHPRAVAETTTGTAILDLRDVTAWNTGFIIKRVSVPISALVSSSAFTVQFAPQPSRLREYRLTLTTADVPRGRGIGLLATRGEGYRDAMLSVNGRNRWGDLVFETTVEGANSNFGSIRSTLAHGGVPAAGVVLVLLLLAKNAALFFLLRAAAIQVSDRETSEDLAGPLSSAPPARI